MRNLRRRARPIFLGVLALLVSACRQSLVHDLSEADANRVVTTLAKYQIEADKERQGDARWNITISSVDSPRALSIIENMRLLRGPRRVLELGSVLNGREEQRFHVERGISYELEETLERMSGVVEARVHLNVPESDPLLGQVKRDERGGASVLLVIESDIAVPEDQVRGIVSGASGVPPATVSVVFNSIPKISVAHADGEGGVRESSAWINGAKEIFDQAAHSLWIQGVISFLLSMLGVRVWMRRRVRLA